MKTTYLFFLLLTFFQACAQPNPVKTTTSEVLQSLQLAVNSRDFSIIEPLLAADYQYETMSGSMARNILSQVITKYPKIDSITFISSLKQGLVRTLSVVIHNKNESSDSQILLDENYNILRADIAKISIKDHASSDVYTNQTSSKTAYTYPFTLSKTGHIVVEASINGVKGNFIVDSGSGEILNLNNEFLSYEETPINRKPLGVMGEISDIGITKIQTFEWGGLSLTELEVSTAALNFLGNNMGIENFAGIIGFRMLKNQILELDYMNKQLTLWNSSESFNGKYQNSHKSSAPIVMVSHIPVIELKFGEQKLRFGLDCAAQGNLLLSKFEEPFTPHLSNKRKELLGGADNHYNEVTKGRLNGLTILDRKYDMDFVFANLFGGHHEVTMIDGLLGYPFLSSQKIAINYIDNQLHFLN